MFPQKYKIFGDTLEKLRKMEKMVYHVQTAHVPGDSNQNPQGSKKLRKVHNLKSFTMKFTFKTGW